MNIGEAAARSGVPAKTIRYYEDIALIDSADRSANGYRAYSEEDVHTLRFIGRARDLGFTMDAIAELLALWRDRSRRSADVKRIALDHVAALKRKVAELDAMAATLSHLADHCHGDDRPHCPILADLAESSAGSGSTDAGTSRLSGPGMRQGPRGILNGRRSRSTACPTKRARGTARHP